jgi:L-iditol 2-dehydrogenase
VPADLVGELLPIDGLDPVAATFVEPLACVLRSQERAGLHPGDSLLVVGAGANGLMQVAAAHARAVEAVWVREPRPERLALAESWGAEHHGNELVDVAIVCTPDPSAIAGAAAWVAPGGTLCLYAPPAPGTALGIEGEGLFMRELTINASYSAGPADMRAALGLLASRRVRPLQLVSHRMTLDQTARALELVRSGEALKAVVVP